MIYRKSDFSSTQGETMNKSKSKDAKTSKRQGNSMQQTLGQGLPVVICTGGVLLLVSTVLPLIFLNSADSPLSWVENNGWFTLSILAFILAMLMPAVMLAIYVSQIEETGVLGLVGFSLMLIGMAAYLGFQFDMAFVWPVLAEKTPELIDFSGPMFHHPGFAFIHSWMGPIHIIGTMLFGITLIKARVFPRIASILFMIGMILSPGVLFPPFLLRAVGGVIGFFALNWIAFSLWNRTRQQSTDT